ncbi:MBL fold metallo-hydrolase [Mucilaginibacter defluvii]|uniref:MBL fold metallo-hydrolase n=1 Tax=Mucilaginibacter defluvii TaxID=1196019 RepID=A0ABP9FN61_9SPHI
MAEITIIGSGDAFGSGGRMSTCFYVKADAGNFLIDCGASAIPGIKKHGIAPDDIDAVLITHFHGDHYGGLPFLLLEMAVYGRLKPLVVISPPGCRERLEKLLELLYPGTEVWGKLNISFHEYEVHKPLDISLLKVTAFPVIHTPEALPHGLRIQVDGKVIAYSGDTSWTDELVPLSADADLFICECNFFGLEVKNHLNYQTLKEKLALLSYKKILLTHFDNEMMRNFDAVELPCASDGMRFAV